MLVLVVCAIAVASPIIAWRWPAGLLLHRWRWPVLIWAAVVLQAVALGIESVPRTLAATLHVLTYVVALVFLVLNWRFPGLIIVGAGALCNGVAIALNGGSLPVSAEAAAAAGIDPDRDFTNAAVMENPVLPWLGDVFAWPAPMPLANTFSVGDILIVVGVFVAAWSGSRRIGAPAPAEVTSAD